jgi:hypothetical protein
MATAYLFRHQHGGVLTRFAFLHPPTDEQMAALGANADAIYGIGWATAVEIEIVEGDAVPELEPVESGSGEPGAGIAGAELMVGSGIGHVGNI